MKVIHKYLLDDAHLANPIVKQLPAGAKLLHFDNQHERMALWAEIDDEVGTEERRFHIVGTGGQVPPNSTHVGTAIFDGGRFVFHAYVEN